jgi:hypothetical protein
VDLCEGGESAPDGPDDTGHLVGHGDGGLVDVSLGEFVRPLPQTIRLLGAGVEKDGAGTVDEEGAQVAVTALGDATQVSSRTAAG